MYSSTWPAKYDKELQNEIGGYRNEIQAFELNLRVQQDVLIRDKFSLKSRLSYQTAGKEFEEFSQVCTND